MSCYRQVLVVLSFTLGICICGEITTNADENAFLNFQVAVHIKAASCTDDVFVLQLVVITSFHIIASVSRA